jgi:hypothetical protein
MITTVVIQRVQQSKTSEVNVRGYIDLFRTGATPQRIISTVTTNCALNHN